MKQSPTVRKLWGKYNSQMAMERTFRSRKSAQDECTTCINLFASKSTINKQKTLVSSATLNTHTRWARSGVRCTKLMCGENEKTHTHTHTQSFNNYPPQYSISWWLLNGNLWPNVCHTSIKYHRLPATPHILALAAPPFVTREQHKPPANRRFMCLCSGNCKYRNARARV